MRMGLLLPCRDDNANDKRIDRNNTENEHENKNGYKHRNNTKTQSYESKYTY